MHNSIESEIRRGRYQMKASIHQTCTSPTSCSDSSLFFKSAIRGYHCLKPSVRRWDIHTIVPTTTVNPSAPVTPTGMARPELDRVCHACVSIAVPNAIALQRRKDTGRLRNMGIISASAWMFESCRWYLQTKVTDMTRDARAMVRVIKVAVWEVVERSFTVSNPTAALNDVSI
jgi:hypothetical protein